MPSHSGIEIRIRLNNYVFSPFSAIFTSSSVLNQNSNALWWQIEQISNAYCVRTLTVEHHKNIVYMLTITWCRSRPDKNHKRCRRSFELVRFLWNAKVTQRNVPTAGTRCTSSMTPRFWVAISVENNSILLVWGESVLALYSALRKKFRKAL